MPMAAVVSRAKKIVRLLEQHYPQAQCALKHESPWQLLIATILSAQCTDARVNQVTPGLFQKYKTAADFAAAPPGSLEKDIHSIGFYNSKAKAIRGACRLIVERHHGKVPKTMEELLELPGVARKTANVVLGTAYGIAAGLVVDTHVSRVAQRLGLTKHHEPGKIEQDLMRMIPRAQWIAFAHYLILHGRSLCKARKPNCPECFLQRLCPYPKNSTKLSRDSASRMR